MVLIYILKPSSRDLPPNAILALGELVAEFTLREKKLHVASIKWTQENSIVYGYYEACEGNHTISKTWRRITGGPKVQTTTNMYYTAIAIPGYSDLKEIVSKGEEISQKTKAAYGATIFENVGFLEFFHTPEFNFKDLIHELDIDITTIVEKTIRNEDIPLFLLNSFSNPSWRCFKFNATRYSARRERGKYWIEVSLEKTGPYITNYWLNGVFYASPPGEIFSVLNSLRGSRFNEIQLYNIELSLRKRVNVAGIELEDITSLIQELYDKAGDKD